MRTQAEIGAEVIALRMAGKEVYEKGGYQTGLSFDAWFALTVWLFYDVWVGNDEQLAEAEQWLEREGLM